MYILPLIPISSSGLSNGRITSQCGIVCGDDSFSVQLIHGEASRITTSCVLYTSLVGPREQIALDTDGYGHTVFMVVGNIG